MTNGNPNGDPDAGNHPRLEPDTGKGLVTDVCLKRKVRNFVEMIKAGQPPHAIYMQERAVLNHQHRKAYEALGIKVEPKKLPREEGRARELTAWMCANFYDIRAFGAVMTTEVNCGQVRGPIQITFAQSIDPYRCRCFVAWAVTRTDPDRGYTLNRKLGCSPFDPKHGSACCVVGIVSHEPLICRHRQYQASAFPQSVEPWSVGRVTPALT